MKKLYSLILLLAALILVQVPAMTQTNPGLFFMEDCTTLANPVAYHTACVNIGSSGSLTQGSIYVATDDTGDSWQLIGPAVAPDLDSVVGTGNSTDGCTQSDPCLFGNGTIKWKVYCDDTNVCIIEPDTAANTQTRIMTNMTWCLYDVEGTSCIETVDPDGATPNAIWQYTTNYKPRKTVAFNAVSLSTDGTNCADPSEQTINSGPKVFTIRCTDAAGVIHGAILMPDSWDGGSLTFTIYATHGTTESIGTDGDVAASCRADSGAISSTYGTAIALDIDVTTANDVEMATSAAVTPNGSCAGGNWLYWKWTKDAAGSDANSANTDILGFNLEYTVASRSD